jgi:hypothetical protein
MGHRHRILSCSRGFTPLLPGLAPPSLARWARPLLGLPPLGLGPGTWTTGAWAAGAWAAGAWAAARRKRCGGPDPAAGYGVAAASALAVITETCVSTPAVVGWKAPYGPNALLYLL